MTTFLQILIDNGFALKPVYIDGGWIEVDTCEDLEYYEEHYDEIF
jgi:NDP-sugar pyrophosphorylase family protein